VGNLFDLNALQEFDLWLESLSAYFRQASKPAGERKKAAEVNYRRQLGSCLEVMGDLVKKCPIILREQAAEGAEGVEIDPGRGNDLKRYIRTHDTLGVELGYFVSFWEFLQRSRVVGLGLGGAPAVGRAEFRAFGSLVDHEIQEIQKNQVYQAMVLRSSDYAFHHVVDRDILSSVEAVGAREELERIFLEFLHILAALQHTQLLMQKSFKHQKLMILLSYCHSSFSQLLGTLDHASQYLDYYQPKIAEAVESVKFGLKIEIQRIFNQELATVSEDQKLQEIFSNMESGLGLLRHASRQSFSSLAQELNPEFDEKMLFRELRNQESAAEELTEDLKRLYDLVREPETQHAEAHFSALLTAMEGFRKGSMRVLYLKDWQPFEQFHKELETSEARERAFILHRFEVFLSTLIGEVSKRAILHRDSSFAGIG
jgi:hypothetical protein